MRVCPQCRSVFRAGLARCAIDGAPLSEQDEDPLVGTTLDGRYEILECLGSGAMATVYRARHAALEFEYAIKVLAGDYAAAADTAKRFRREALWMSRMQHPNVVSVKDFGTTQQGLTFLVMEFVNGRTLREAIDEGGPVGPGTVARLIRQLASGLHEAHRQSYVHRDLKPSNIMVSSGIAKIFDFGLVGLDSAHDSDVSREGYVMGTPTYMAPEQASNGDIGPAADLYALGVIAFEMVTGRVPYRGRSITETLVMHIMDPIPPVPMKHPIAELITALMSKKPEQRPVSALDVVARVDEMLETEADTGAEARLRGPEAAPTAFSLTGDLLPPPKGTDARAIVTLGPQPTHSTHERKRLGSILIEAAYISSAQLDNALAIVSKGRKRLGRALVDEGYLTEDHLVRALARHISLDECNPELPVHAKVLECLPRTVAEQHCVMPVALERSRGERTLVVATFDPFDEQAETAVRSSMPPDLKLRWALATERAIRSAIARHFDPQQEDSNALGAPSKAGRATATVSPAGPETPHGAEDALRGSGRTQPQPSVDDPQARPGGTRGERLSWLRSARSRES